MNEHLDPHQAYEDGWLERRIETHRDEVERFDAPTDAQVVARLPHDKRGVPIVCNCIVMWSREKWLVRSIFRNGGLTLQQTTKQGGERQANAAPGNVEVVDFGKSYF